MRFSLRWAILAVAAAGTLAAQGYKAALLGRITDAAGLPLPRAAISAIRIDTSAIHRTRTDDDGRYVLNGLEPGAYDVSISAAGFRTQRRVDVRLEVNAVARIDATLDLGPVSEQVTVEDSQPALAMDTGMVSSAILGTELANLPLNGRNYRNLALLTPGVVPAPSGANPHHVNGGRSDHVTYLLDGTTSMDRRGNQSVVQPPLDSIQEFRVLANSFSAEYGRLGSGVISVALKSGANRLHGTVFAFVRNDVFDARGFFDARTPQLRRNQFGAVVGGRVIPNRLFFLAAYEGYRNRDYETRLARVPSLAERGGVVGPALDPDSGAVFPGGMIPAARLDRTASRLLDLFPLPNRDGALNYISTGSIVDNRDNAVVRLDLHASERHYVSARMLMNVVSASNPFRATNVPGYGSLLDTRNQYWGLNYTRVLTSSFTNEFRIAFGRSRFAESSVNEGRNTAADSGIAGVPAGAGLPAISIAGYATLGDPVPLPDRWTDNEYILSNTAALVRGSHWIRTGGEFQRSQHFNLFAAYRAGQIAFLSGVTRNPFAGFLLGMPTATQRQVGTNKSYLFSNTGGLFVQDDWRLHPRLTLNLGLRYEAYAPPVEKYNHWANFIPEAGGRILAGDPRFPRNLMQTHWRNFAPRFGFAWRPTGSDTTVVRGGYGIFYAADLQFTLYQLLGASAYPFTHLELFQTSATLPLRLATPFPNTTSGVDPGSLSPNGWEFANPTPYQQQWNLTVGRKLGGSLAMEAAYVGSKATHQSVSLNLNQNIRTPQGVLVPYPGYGRILWQSLGGNATYHSLQVSVRRQFGHLLGFRSGFTWSKAMDFASYGSAARQPQNPRDLQAEHAVADFHRGRTLTADGVFVVPFGRGRKFGSDIPGVLELLAGGWRLNGIFRWYDGLPFTPVISGANQQAGEAVRPDRLGSGKLADPSVNRWFQVSDFRAVSAGEYRFGNSGRNILVGPSQLTLDLSLFKEFRMASESHRLQLRLEAFNAPNRANFGQPNPALDSPAAGTIGAAQPGRQLQLALKYLF